MVESSAVVRLGEFNPSSFNGCEPKQNHYQGAVWRETDTASATPAIAESYVQISVATSTENRRIEVASPNIRRVVICGGFFMPKRWVNNRKGGKTMKVLIKTTNKSIRGFFNYFTKPHFDKFVQRYKGFPNLLDRCEPAFYMGYNYLMIENLADTPFVNRDIIRKLTVLFPDYYKSPLYVTIIHDDGTRETEVDFIDIPRLSVLCEKYGIKSPLWSRADFYGRYGTRGYNIFATDIRRQNPKLFDSIVNRVIRAIDGTI